MSEIEPRTHIAEEWASKAACPVCHERGLQVNHTPGVPDRTACPTCNVAYEISQEFTHIRLTRLPNRVISQRLDLLDVWVTPVELGVAIEKGSIVIGARLAEAPPFIAESPARPESRSILASLPPLTQDEVTRRLLTLSALGNPLEDVRVTLAEEGATEEQMRLAEETLAGIKQAKKQRTWRRFWIVTGLSGLAIAAIVIWLAMNGYPPF